MSDNPYGVTSSAELTLRDHLASARTVLANERTFLAFLRTALSLIAAGAFLVKFVSAPSVQVLGWICIPVGAGVLFEGIRRYRNMKAYITQLTRGGDSLRS